MNYTGLWLGKYRGDWFGGVGAGQPETGTRPSETAPNLARQVEAINARAIIEAMQRDESPDLQRAAAEKNNRQSASSETRPRVGGQSRNAKQGMVKRWH